MSDFSNRPFSAGSVFGLRSFRLSVDGFLVGVRGNTWVSGENVAECRRTTSDWLITPHPQEPHRPGTKDCTCGFYAYFDGSNDYGGQWHVRITSVIEGYGVVTIGSRGFRCEKARMVAFAIGHSDWGPDLGLAERYPGVPMYGSQEDMLAAHPISNPEDFGITPSPFRQFAAGGYVVVPSVAVNWTDTIQAINASARRASEQLQKLAASMGAHACGTAQELTEEPADPVARMRQRAEEAARRRQANLRNFNGINRRKRSL